MLTLRFREERQDLAVLSNRRVSRSKQTECSACFETRLLCSQHDEGGGCIGIDVVELEAEPSIQAVAQTIAEALRPWRRRAIPATPTPMIISAQLDGSGAPETVDEVTEYCPRLSP